VQVKPFEKPNWSTKPELIYSFLTDTMQASGGAEQRVALRQYPRVQNSLMYTLQGVELWQFKNKISGWGKDEYVLPDENWFLSPTDAEQKIEAWRIFYNQVRPIRDWSGPRVLTTPGITRFPDENSNHMSAVQPSRSQHAWCHPRLAGCRLSRDWG